MARAAKQVEGVYEKNKGSGIWYARYRLNAADEVTLGQLCDGLLAQISSDPDR
jgi:hypothetical protein